MAILVHVLCTGKDLVLGGTCRQEGVGEVLLEVVPLAVPKALEKLNQRASTMRL